MDRVIYTSMNTFEKYDFLEMCYVLEASVDDHIFTFWSIVNLK